MTVLKYFGLLLILFGCSVINKNISTVQDDLKGSNEDNGVVLLVANKHSNTLSFVDLNTFEIIESIYAGINPHEIALTPDNRFAYCSSYIPPGDKISVIDLIERKLVKEIPTGEYTRIHGVAISRDGKNGYFTAGQSGVVVEIDIETNEISRIIPTEGEISHLVYISPDDKTLYTGNLSSNDISVIDRKTGEILKKIKCGRGSGGMSFTPDLKHLWVLNEGDGTISIIDVSINEVVETMECPGVLKRTIFTTDGKLAMIASWTERGEVIFIDVDKRKIIKRVTVGDRAIGLILSPDERYLFAGCEDFNCKNVIEDTDNHEKIEEARHCSDGVHVIDMDHKEVVRKIKTGLGPDPMVLWYPPYDYLKTK